MSLDLTSYQEEIYSGLCRIGEEIANFYIDGIRMLKSDDYYSKSYLLGHIAREIDGGIRDILASEHLKVYDGSESKDNTSNKLSHIESILLSLGLSDNSDFSNKWHKIASKFHKYAHRHGPFRESREPSEIIELWHKYEQILHELIGSFLAITDRIDRILRFESPAKEVTSALANLLLDNTLEAYFYKTLSNPKWFIPLYKNNFFDCSKLRQSIEIENGIRYKYWNQLFYFKNLIENYPIGSLDENVYKGIVEIIVSLSKVNLAAEEPRNPYIWHEVIEILSGIPILYHSKSLYEYIPSWFVSNDDNLLSSSDLVNKLFPHILEDEGSKELKEHFLFTALRFKEKSEYSYYNKFEFVFQNHWLGSDEAIESISSKIAENLSIESIVEYFVKSLCKINWYQLPHSEIKFPEDESHRIVLDKNDTSVNVEILNNKNEKEWINTLSNCQQIEFKASSETIWEPVIYAISDLNIPLSDDIKNKIMGSIKFYCEHDFNNEHLQKLHSIESHHRDDTHIILVRLLYMVLSKAAQIEPEKVVAIMDSKLLSERYDIFRRIIVQVIADSYENLSIYFWELVNSKQYSLLFSDYIFNELYYLLYKNCLHFTEEQSRHIKNLIFNSSKNIERNSKKWIFRYIAALRKNALFKKDYEILSQELNLTNKDIEEFGQVKIGWSKDEAYSATEFDTIPIIDIINRLLSFESKGGWDDPDEGSLGIMLQNSATKEPRKYSQNLSLFTNVPPIYIHYLLSSFENLWNNDQEIDWLEILNFINQYLDHPLFGSTEFERSKSSSLRDYQFALRSIGQLISCGTKADEHAFDFSLLPVAQEILLKCTKWVVDKEDFVETNMDYPTYFLNTTNGKIIEALILLSLRIARTKGYSEDSTEIKWNKGLRDAFELLLTNNILEAYITLGFFFRNLLYLDSNWTINKIISNQTQKSSLLWRAIIESYVFNSYIIDEESVYEAFKPYYLRYIHYADEKYRYSGIIDHCGGYFFRGKDKLIETSAINTIVKSGKPFLVNSLVNNIWRNWKNNLFSIQSKADTFEEYIIMLWREIINTYNEHESDESKKCISLSTKFLSVFSRIDDRIISLILESCEFLNYGFDTPYLIEELLRLKDQGEPIATANFITDIYLKMLDVVTPDYNSKHIQLTIESIYEIEDDSLKEKCNKVCNTYASRGNYLLRDIFSKYNPL